LRYPKKNIHRRFRESLRERFFQKPSDKQGKAEITQKITKNTIRKFMQDDPCKRLTIFYLPGLAYVQAFYMNFWGSPPGIWPRPLAYHTPEHRQGHI